MARLNTSKFCVVELSNVAAVRTGEIVSQIVQDAGLKTAGMQQGMLYFVDYENKVVKLPTGSTQPVYLHASEEQMYNDFEGREDFILKAPKMPRLYKLTVGDVIYTDAIELAGLTVATAKFAVAANDGFATLKNSAYVHTADPVVFLVEAAITLPNGKPGARLRVIKANY
jgi:hypothetical protein